MHSKHSIQLDISNADSLKARQKENNVAGSYFRQDWKKAITSAINACSNKFLQKNKYTTMYSAFRIISNWEAMCHVQTKALENIYVHISNKLGN